MTTLVLMLVLGQSSPAETVQELGPLYVRVECPRTTFGLSEKLAYRITVQTPERMQAEIFGLEPGSTLGPFQVVSLEKKGTDRFDGRFGSLVLSTWTLELEPLREGTLAPDPLPIRYRDGDEEWTQVEAKAPTVQVKAHYVAEGDAASLRPLPVLPEPESGGVRRSQTRLLGMALLFAGAAVGVLTACRRGNDPLRAARKQLQRLEQSEPASFREGVTEVAHAVRTYLQLKYGMLTESHSTPEVLAEIAGRNDLPEIQQVALRDFFESADMERFAEKEPERVDWLRSLQQAQAFLMHEQKG